MVIYWIYIYNLNEDLCTVEYKRFYEKEEDVLPSLSICLKIPFLQKELEKINPASNATTYFQFLQGNMFNPEWLKIDYHAILKDPNNYLTEDWISFRNGTYIPIHPMYKNFFHKTTSSGIEESQKIFSGKSFFHEMYFFHCYELSMPLDRNLQSFYFRGNKSFLETDLDPGNKDVLFFLHHPNQLLASIKTIRYYLPHKHQHEEPYLIRLKIRAMEVLRRRQKDRRPCNEKWQNYDNEIINSHIKSVGCRPPYMNNTKIGIACATPEQLKKAMFFLNADENDSLPPCVSMENMHFTYETQSYDTAVHLWARNEDFWIGVEFYLAHFKEIKQIR